MRRWNLNNYAISCCVCAAVLAGCGGTFQQAQSELPIGAPGTMPQSRALAARGHGANYKVLYSFQGSPGGAFPVASLVDVNNTLYGTTRGGGTTRNGVVFGITTAGTERTLYSFGKDPDGAGPVASLIDLNGSLYGTTYYGGRERRGTVFSVSTGGVEQVLHQFLGKGSHGNHPAASLINVDGVLYGTTDHGGTHGAGTVFSVTADGTEKVLHSFGGSADGAQPHSALTDVNGTLYGTTEAGGTYGRGSVFSITRSGTEKVLHSFGYGTDGSKPLAGLLDVHGTLYGTTYSIGAAGDGTVFSITTSGTEKVVHAFGGGDGFHPEAGLINVGSTLYGTTYSGGGSSACTYGCGVVFSITTTGKEKVVHAFTGGSDGEGPGAQLLDVAGVLYGTTTEGGVARSKCGCFGWGTVFALSP